MFKVFLFLSMIINVILFFILISTKFKLEYLKKLLDDVLSGNVNRKLMLNNNMKSIRNLVNNINRLIDKIAQVENEKIKKTDTMARMISNISHDFKTPLTSLIGYIELIKESSNLSKEELNEYIDIVHNKSYYLNSMLEKFFYLAKLEAMDEKFTIEEINLTDIIQEQMAFFYNDFKSVGLNPIVKIPEESVYALADKTSVTRILHNLLSNSLKYAKDGNKVGISTREDNNNVYIEVWDNGKGIPDKDTKLIFDRLYTVEGSRSAKISGTGIGLSIVKQLVKSNNGDISVESTPFERTSFIFSLLKNNQKTLA